MMGYETMWRTLRSRQKPAYNTRHWN